MPVSHLRSSLLAVICSCALVGPLWAQVPHGQDKPPGPALSPEEAVKKMTVPEGFSVEVFASEPDIVNPVAMTLDERGRFWITESFEYPRREAGPGRDRVKIVEDTDGDGKADKFTVFAEGLNIPSGIAVGHGGVWVANSPDLLFMQDTDGDGKADKQEVVVTGFGRDDTHELPNSLTWGPDGWLYGINGVFNHSHVKYPANSPHYKKDHPGFPFTCALFRIHPKTREFQVWCEGTSNPWGVTFDTEGSAFISACVIDHLWHLTESGYYHRQGGPYPPFTWKLESIVKHRHQKAAYCGIHYYDSDTYPEQYRNKLYMGNIHGGCLNVDKLQRAGASYFATIEPDFITANDAWFMPVVQKTGYDGCLYVLDWYDRYHCYQDANRDPAGIDRAKGRLYRIRYKDAPYAKPLDLAKKSDAELIALLGSGNGLFRELAQRLLTERLLQGKAEKETAQELQTLVMGASAPRPQRMHALFVLASSGPLDPSFHKQLLAHDDATFRAWGVRAAGNAGEVDPAIQKQIVALAEDSSPDVKLQVAIAAKKLRGVESVNLLMAVLGQSGDDKLIPHIVWQNLHPMLEKQTGQFIAAATKLDPEKAPGIRDIMPRAIDRIIAVEKPNPVAIATLFTALASGAHPDVKTAGKCLEVLAARVQSRELEGEELAELKAKLEQPVNAIIAGDKKSELYFHAVLLASGWGNKEAIGNAILYAADTAVPDSRRIAAFDAVVALDHGGTANLAQAILSESSPAKVALRGSVLSSLGRSSDPKVASVVKAAYPNLEGELKPRAIELLTARTAWAKELLTAIEKKEIPADALNANQVRKLLSLGDKGIAESVVKNWGSIRTERDPAREETIATMRKVIRGNAGDPHKGQEVFKKLCGQCHKMHGEGQEVGPDITVNGRGSFEQLLSNVFDPSLVIGASYQARTVVTEDGRVLTGLLVEDNDQRIVLKQQGGKLETIARDDVDEVKVSPLSLMPEGIEKQYQQQEIVDLFAFLTLDKPPSDSSARFIPGTKEIKPREEFDPKKFGEMLNDVLPGFGMTRNGEGRLILLGEHQGRSFVIRTHPIDRSVPAVLSRKVVVPEGKKTRLVLSASHHAEGDWKLIVKVDGKPAYENTVGAKTAPSGWLDVSVDLTPYAGKTINLELLNQPTDWANEYGFWARADVISE